MQTNRPDPVAPPTATPTALEPALDTRNLSGAFALLAEMTQDFADTMDVDGTLLRALERIALHLKAEAGSLWLLDPEQSRIVCKASVGLNPITGASVALDEGIIGRSVRTNESQNILDVSSDPDFARRIDESSSLRTCSLLCAPLSFSDRAIGAIELVNKRSESRCFSEADGHLLQVLAASAALAISNARMAEAVAEHQRVRRELELAAEIQRNLLPAPLPEPFPVRGANVPARTVSGDFYDILSIDDGREDVRIAFCLGDVSGKGMNAALLMAKTASLYRCLARSTASPGELLERLNDELVETATRGMFVTMMAGVLYPKRGVVCIANAGHEPPLLRDAAGDYTSVPADAPPLGILPGQTFLDRELRLAGGTLYVFSDGLTEACVGEEAVGADGVAKLIDRFAERPLGERVGAVLDELRTLEPSDDLTLLAVRGD